MKTFIRSIFVILLMFGFHPAHAMPVSLSLTPNQTIAATGDPVTLDLIISGLGDFSARSLSDFDLDIMWNPLKLQFDSASLGGFLGTTIFDTVDNYNPGLLTLAQSSLELPDFLNANQPGSFLLASINFLVLNLAPFESTSVGFNQVYALGDELGDPLDYTTHNAKISNGVNVPTPSVLMFLIAAAFPALRNWRNKIC